MGFIGVFPHTGGSDALVAPKRKRLAFPLCDVSVAAMFRSDEGVAPYGCLCQP